LAGTFHPEEHILFSNIAIFIAAKKLEMLQIIIQLYQMLLFFFNKCLASNSSQMQSNIGSEYQFRAIK